MVHTVKEHETSYGSPYPPSARVGADSKYDSTERGCRAPYGKLHNITCTSPCGAKRRILLIALIGDFCRKIAAFIIFILKFALAIGTRDSCDLLFTSLGEPVCGGDLGGENLWTVDNEPGLCTISIGWRR